MKKQQKRRTGFLKGHTAVLRTGPKLYEYELSYIPGEADPTATDCPTLTELQPMRG